MKTILNISTTMLIIIALLIINTSNLSGQWINLGGPPVAKDVRDISAGYKNGTLFTIYAADEIYLSKSTDQGNYWTHDTTTKSPLLVACMPNDPDTLLVAKGTDVLRSTNGGGSFNTAPITRVDPLRILYSRGAPRDAWVGTKYQAGKSSLRRSTDGGAYFEEIQYFAGTATNQPKTNVEDVWTVPSNPNVVWVAGASYKSGEVSGLWRSTNRGNNWSDRNLLIHPQTGKRRITVDITAVTTNPNGNRIFFGNQNGYVYEYKILSSTSDTIIKISEDLGKKILRLRATNTNLFVASETGFYAGPIGGQLTKVPNIILEVLSLEIDPRNEGRIFVGTNQYVYVSTDSGKNFTQLNPKTTTVLNSKAVAASGNVVLAIAERSKNNDAIYRYNGTEWSAVDMLFAKNKFFIGKGNTIGNGFYMQDSNRLFTFGKIDDSRDSILMAYSDNKGLNWNRVIIQPQASSPKINGILRWEGKDTLFAYGDNVSLFGGKSTNLIKSRDGTNWQAVNKIGISTSVPEILSITSKDNNTAFAGTSDGLYITASGGNIWVPRPEATNGKKKILSTALSEPYVFCATTQGLFIYNYTTFASELLRKGSYKQVMAYNNNLYVLRDRSGSTKPDTIFKVTTGATWVWDTVAINRSAYDIRKFTIANDNIYAATDNGVFVTSISKTTTASSIVPPVVGGSNPSNIVWQSGSTVVINGAPTIPSGSTLTIEPGVNIVMTAGSQIRVQGELNIQGNTNSKVRFISENPSQRWGGIYLAKDSRADIENVEITGAVAGIIGAKAELNLTSSEIKNCLIGVGLYGKTDEPSKINSTKIEQNAWGVVTLNNSSPVLSNNIVSGGQKGILIEASNPQLFSNTISNNTQVGVVIYGGGYCRFSDITTSGTGSNTIQGNQITQVLAVKGTAFLGYQSGTLLNSFGGDNIIQGADPNAPLGAILEYSQLVNLKVQSTLSKSTALESEFLVDETSRIIEDPIDPDPDPQLLLLDAYNNRRSGLLQDAIVKYKTIISNYPSATQANQALNELRETYQELIRIGAANASDQLRVYLESLSSHTNVEVVRSASLYAAREYAASDDSYTAVEKYQSAIDRLNQPLDSDLKISAFISKIMLEGYDTDNIEAAEETFGQMLNQFPNDERTQLAQLQLQLMQAEQQDVSVFSKAGEFQVKMRELPKFGSFSQTQSIPTTYALQQNYPNPFNPSTLIKYQIPQANKVELKIYNIFGQEVKKLVDEIQDAGYYVVVWNGENNTGNQVASGVYFYRLTAGSFSETKKLILMRYSSYSIKLPISSEFTQEQKSEVLQSRFFSVSYWSGKSALFVSACRAVSDSFESTYGLVEKIHRDYVYIRLVS